MYASVGCEWSSLRAVIRHLERGRHLQRGLRFDQLLLERGRDRDHLVDRTRFEHGGDRSVVRGRHDDAGVVAHQVGHRQQLARRRPRHDHRAPLGVDHVEVGGQDTFGFVLEAAVEGEHDVAARLGRVDLQTGGGDRPATGARS